MYMYVKCMLLTRAVPAVQRLQYPQTIIIIFIQNMYIDRENKGVLIQL